MTRPILALLLIVLAAPIQTARAGSPYIQDGTNFFSPNAIRQADQTIEQIRRDYHVRVLIQTGAVPEGNRFHQWMRRTWQRVFAIQPRPPQYGERTIVIRLVREPAPGQVEIAVGADPGLQKAFPPTARAELHRLFLASLQKPQSDAALRDGLAFIRNTLAGNLGEPFDWSVPGSLLACFLAAWLVLEALRWLGVGRWRRAETTEPAIDGAGSLGPILFAMMIRGDYRHAFRKDDAQANPALADPEPGWHQSPEPAEASSPGGHWAERRGGTP